MSRPQQSSRFASRTTFEALAMDSGSDESDEEIEELPQQQTQEEEGLKKSSTLEKGKAQEIVLEPQQPENTAAQPQDLKHSLNGPDLANRDERPKTSKSAAKKAARQTRQQVKDPKSSGNKRQSSKASSSTRSPSSDQRRHGHLPPPSSVVVDPKLGSNVGETRHNERDHSPPGSIHNPLELPAETEVEESARIASKAVFRPDTSASESSSAKVAQSVLSGNVLLAGREPVSPKSQPAFPPSSSFSKSLPKVPPPLDAAFTSQQHYQPSPHKSSFTQQNGELITGDGRKARQGAKEKEPLVPVLIDDVAAEKTKKKQNLLVRTLWTLIMIAGFLGCLTLGHAYMIVLVLVCQTLVYREVTALFALGVPKGEADGKDPWSKTLNWYFFAVTNYFLYGESLIYYFKHVVFADAQLLPFATNHRFISFSLYTIGFVGFVASLQRQYLKSQFGLFCWVHMTLLVIVVSSHFIVNNILEGLIWFWVPASLVICNDIFAYIWGITFGRTPLIKLSPKKTVEGFVGAFFSTIVFALIWGTFFMRFDYMICPAQNLGVNAFSGVTCEPNPAFVWREWEMWAPLRMALSTLLGRTVTTIPYLPYQFHLLVMSCFASLVAPFGGFFASGFKRAFDIKDFGHSIPGHGGMTDRMDCQFLMGVFTYVYYSSLVKEHHVTVGSVLQLIVSGLTLDEQVELMVDFRRYLEGRGVTV